MAPNTEWKYLARWFAKAEDEGDVFDKFMAGWLAMSIAARRHCTRYSVIVPGHKDSLQVIAYLKSNADSVQHSIREHGADMMALANRNGTRKGQVVINGLQTSCKKFQGRILRSSSCTDLEFAEATAEILNRVRNNLFHGDKGYDDTEDRALLDLVTPFLLTFLANSEGLRKPKAI